MSKSSVMKSTPSPLTEAKTGGQSNNSRFRRMAWLLSLFGFLPFLVLTGSLFVLDADDGRYLICLNALKAYGAVILSFLGGIRWGGAMHSRIDGRSAKILMISMVPSLFGWFSLYLSAPYVFAVQALAFAGQGAWDALAGEKGTLGLWYVKLRSVLTLLVAGSLIAAFFATV